MKRKNIIRIATITVAILLIPFIAMQFTEEVEWDLLDFTVMGALLFGTGLVYELLAKHATNISYRIGAGIAVLSSLALIWINLAVGIIGDESFEANLLYVGVLAIGLVGAILARLHAQGMANTLFAMTFAQLLVPLVTLRFWESAFTVEMIGTFVLNTFFAISYLISALLFQHAVSK